MYSTSLSLAKRPMQFFCWIRSICYLHIVVFTFQTSIVTTRRVLERIVVRHVSQRTAWKLLKGNNASLIFPSLKTYWRGLCACDIWWGLLIFLSPTTMHWIIVVLWILCSMAIDIVLYHHVRNFNMCCTVASETSNYKYAEACIFVNRLDKREPHYFVLLLNFLIICPSSAIWHHSYLCSDINVLYGLWICRDMPWVSNNFCFLQELNELT